MHDLATFEISVQDGHSGAAPPVQPPVPTEAAARVDVTAIRNLSCWCSTRIRTCKQRLCSCSASASTASRGVLRGLAAWQDAGCQVSSYEVVDVASFARAIADGSAGQILDVRSPSEWQTGTLPGAHGHYVPDLADGVPSELDATQPVRVLCGSGFRASIAAGLLQRRDYTPIVLANGGVADLVGHTPA